MPRRARVVFEGVVHHITQRGNYRQSVFIEIGTDSIFWYNLC